MTQLALLPKEEEWTPESEWSYQNDERRRWYETLDDIGAIPTVEPFYPHDEETQPMPPADYGRHLYGSATMADDVIALTEQLERMTAARNGWRLCFYGFGGFVVLLLMFVATVVMP